jgi:membrane fusion protein (multidrug efflux system)
MPVITVVKMDRVKVEAGVPENYVNHVRQGTNTRIVFKDLNGIEYKSKLTFVGNAISTTNRTFPVEVVLNNFDGKIKPELSAMVYIEKNNFDNAVIVPEEVIVKTDLGYVLFVEDNGIARMRKVEIISRYNSMAAVRSGLNDGDKLITVGYQNLVDGEKVKVVN